MPHELQSFGVHINLLVLYQFKHNVIAEIIIWIYLTLCMIIGLSWSLIKNDSICKGSSSIAYKNSIYDCASECDSLGVNMFTYQVSKGASGKHACYCQSSTRNDGPCYCTKFSGSHLYQIIRSNGSINYKCSEYNFLFSLRRK